jgi:DNA-binding transcriptional ArsR family regulator
MANLAGEIRSGIRPKRDARRPYRRGANFVRDPLSVSTPLNRDERGRLLRQAEQLERRSKGKGKRSGLLGLTGLAVLRALVLRFANRESGLCIPSYSKIQEVTGFARQTIAKALRALEAAGILKVVRRLVRRLVERADGSSYVGTVQASNAYSFKLGGVVAINWVSRKPDLPRSFPRPAASLLALLVGRKLSSPDRE